MDKDYFIRLTNNLYKLTLLFPKKEPLRYKMRELADEILAKPTEKNLEILDNYFEVAKSQNWVSPVDILRIQEEYSRIKAEIKKIPKRIEIITKEEAISLTREKKIRQGKILDYNPPSTRQRKILEFLKEKGKVQVGEFQEIFPEVTKRTLRRDFEQLLNQGSIERIGQRNKTFYLLKSS